MKSYTAEIINTNTYQPVRSVSTRGRDVREAHKNAWCTCNLGLNEDVGRMINKRTGKSCFSINKGFYRD